MKYGIKHSNGIIEAISAFSENVPVGFIEITKEKYDEFVSVVNNNSSVFYDASQNTVLVNASENYEINEAIEKQSLKDQLRFLSIEIDTLTKMGEQVTDLQTEFANILSEYNRQTQV